MLPIDQAIAQLEKLRADIGGNAAVVSRTSGMYVRGVDKIGTTSVGKGDASRFVTRGGVPVVLVILSKLESGKYRGAKARNV